MNRRPRSDCTRTGPARPLAGLQAVLLGLLPALAPAQVLRDGSIGPDSGVQAAGPDYLIDQSMGQLSGTNLFHSFSQFDLSAGESASFTAVDPVTNLIARITGGASRIDGSVVSLIPGANLFLLNPAGLLLGPDASFEVDGSLYLSSANYLGFGDQQQWPTGAVSGALLSSAPPSAFGFTTAAPAPLTLAGGSLEVAEGAAIWMLGGALSLTGATDDTLLQAESGQVALISLAGAGEVALDPAVEPAVTDLGPISLIGTAAEDDAGDDPAADADDDADDAAEDPRPTAQIDVSGEGAGGVLLRGASLQVGNFIIAADTLGADDGSAGGIQARISGAVTLSGESLFGSSTTGAGAGGQVVIAADSISLTEDAELLSDTLADGAGGQVRLQARQLSLSGDAEIASDAEAAGAGGSVVIEVDRLLMLGNPEISSDTDPSSTATGGSVRITANESVVLRISGDEPAGIFTNSEGLGDAGAIRIDTPILDMNAGVITAETSAAGRGGNVEINAAQIRMRNGASIAALSSAESAGAGDAGDVRISGVQRLDLDDAGILTQSGFSDGGNIAITGQGLVLLRNSRLSANVGDGVGGNLDLALDSVILHKTRVVAQAGAGQGGAISIAANRFLDSETLISASSETGISGTVDINAPEVDLSGSLSAPPAEFADVAALLQASCTARNPARAQSSFSVANRRGLPADGDGLPLQRDDISGGQAGLIRADTDAWIEVSERARSLAADQPAEARALLQQAEAGLAQSAGGSPRVYARIHLAGTAWRLAEADPDRAEDGLLRAHALLTQANAEALALDDPRASAYALGNLGLLYRSEHRLDEALLLARRALQAAERANAPESVYRWHWLQAQVLWQQGRATPAMAAFRAAIQVLEATRQEAFVRAGAEAAFFSRSIAPVYMEMVDALLQATDRVQDAATRDRLLHEARATIERFRAAELRDYFSDPCVTELQARSTGVDQLAVATAIIYPILLPERLELLVTLPGGLRRYVVDVDPQTLARESRRFRLALQQTQAQRYLSSGRRLYDWLIRPMAAELAAAGVETLVLVPDGPLRGIPLAALLDGDTFLIERYAVAVSPGLNLVDALPLRRDGLQVLLAGLSQSVQGFSALPNVPRELDAVQALFGGDLLLNQDFRLDRLQSALAQGTPGLVHIASHAQFGGRPEDSFVLTFDGRLSMNRLSDYVGLTRFREQPLEMLVLSACQTAVGDDRAALGLAGVAVQAGARSVLGSLWSIADEAAAELIRQFYLQMHQPGVSRAAALRHAQLELLRRDDFKHPFFWSPFLLISNWL